MVNPDLVMPTPEEIEKINKERAKAMRLIEEARVIFNETGCPLGAHTVLECAQQLVADGCTEY